MCTGTWRTDASPRGPSLGGILKGCSVERQVASEKEKKSGKGFNGEELDFNLGCHQVYPVHLHPTLVVEPGRMRKEPVSVRRRLNLTGKESFSVKSVSTPI